MPDDHESTTGYHYTHFDCPYCGSAHEAEGDVRGETFNCQDCREPFVVR